MSDDPLRTLFGALPPPKQTARARTRRDTATGAAFMLLGVTIFLGGVLIAAIAVILFFYDIWIALFGGFTTIENVVLTVGLQLLLGISGIVVTWIGISLGLYGVKRLLRD
ncbi:hypothetical protein FHX48_000912 [Microbacterium halimionae]|uniref:Uncharacterized protein n=1 Tax=Microbacterium halimionae TaxID=1526413 RepID=A0A7W3JN02_9MICO|nr:hypothetical protein [Microbacterium halimionae]MBA8815860.1 hypothetical protein [Microbacterium halimionae]NII95906.1 hypothetical protein [Microbacterium halimionae]